MKAFIFIIILFLLFLIPTCSAQVLNGGFEDTTYPPLAFDNWTYGEAITGNPDSTNNGLAQVGGHTGSWAVNIRSNIQGNDETSSSYTTYLHQNVDFTGYGNLTFYYAATRATRDEPNYEAEACIYIGNDKYILPWISPVWNYYVIDVSEYNGIHTLKLSSYFRITNYTSLSAYTSLFLDQVILTELPKISGYVTNNFNNSVSAATITLNNSGGSTTSNDTGYYEITGIQSGTYSITATSPTHQDYSDTVSITTDTEKNISMTRLTPVLSNVGIIDSSESTLRIGWKENAVVDSVRIYQGTNTNLIATEDTSYVSLASYTVGNLDADTGYNFWLEPWDGAVSGSKYYVSGTTDGDGGGGGGGGPISDPTPRPTTTPRPTPGPTAPPYTNYTDEDWLNLTRYEQEYILFEHDQLNITIGTYTPKAVNLSFWYLILFLGICSTAYGSQKKNGELLFTCGLVAVVISMIKLGLF